jgi:NAD(P)-dependent dehydrogenase (short-subunit alcohol dehydrogenase family)
LGWLDGTTALVTGGGSGIGKGVVEAFLQEGARVGVLEIRPARVKELGKLGPSVAAVAGDVTSLEDNERAVSQVVSKWGKLDTLVCCAGVFDGFTPLIDIPGEKLSAAFDELYGVNVKGYLFSTKAAIPELIKTNGTVIYTVSHAGYAAGGGGALYTSSKFAVRGLVKQMAHELAPQVRVNGVAPGGVLTDLRGIKTLGLHDRGLSSAEGVEERMKKGNPLRVAPKPIDIAWAYVYLASRPRSRIVTGATIQADGGTGARGLVRLSGLLDEEWRE